MPHTFYKFNNLVSEYIDQTKDLVNNNPELQELIEKIEEKSDIVFDRINRLERNAAFWKEQYDHIDNYLDEMEARKL